VKRPENATYAYVGVLIDELVRSGVGHLCLCPGSRSTPLAITAARHPRMRAWTLIDERSAGFFALGMARALRQPVAVLSTSGTAPANFFPAVIEARYGRVPLVVLTADRPPELRDCAAPQTIDQIRLFGQHAKWCVDVAEPRATADLLRYARTLACQAVAIARADPAGPVHLNVPLRDPLVPVPAPDEIPAAGSRAAALVEGRDAGLPFTVVSRAARSPDAGTVEELADEVRRRKRGVIVCGPQDDPALPEAVSGLAQTLGYPILADPLSQVRCGGHDRSRIVDSYDAFLRAKLPKDALTPDIILRIGGVPTSKPLWAYLHQHSEVPHVVVDGAGGWDDPARIACRFVYADARLLCEALTSACDPQRADPSWTGLWRRLDARSRQAIQERLEHVDEPFEGKVFAELAGLLPRGSTLYAGNSMPVRDLDTFFPSGPGPVRFLGNRGASGIDGLVSSALGAAAVSAGPVVLALGDLAFHHDSNGLLAAKLHRLRATVVLLNNDGGGIFSFLPQADYAEHFEALFGTPTGLEFRHAAEMYGAAFVHAGTWEDFRTGIREGLVTDGVRIVEVRTERGRNVALHKAVWTAVEDALRDELRLGVPGRTS
jgi:2-succinyl-5-enolpyruvyl-6-hydroxy-3-cyclohexene-1-carboxylate synthase